jgi:hypothetical protein
MDEKSSRCHNARDAGEVVVMLGTPCVVREELDVPNAPLSRDVRCGSFALDAFLDGSLVAHVMIWKA